MTTGLPLEGMRLVDFSQGVAGPYCAMQLAELGAQVIKIEPDEGDWLRSVGHQVRPLESSAHLSLNRNKRSICLNLRHPDGARIAQALVAKSQIVVQNYRVGVLEKFGLGYDQIRQVNPRLVYATILGYGAQGPLASAPATDSVMQAFGGLMSINGDGEVPLRMGNMVSDMVAGTYLSQGVLAALLTLARSGKGQEVTVSLLDALLAFQSAPVAEFLDSGVLPKRSGSRHPMISPSGTYKVRDGFVTLVATQQLWKKFCLAIGMPELTDDRRFADNDARLTNRDSLQALITPFFAQRTREEILGLARDHDLVCAPINDYQALTEHEQVQANHLLQSWTHPVLGQARGVRNPVRYGEFDPAWGPPPMLGEHTHEVLRDDLGFADDEIARVRASGAVTIP